MAAQVALKRDTEDDHGVLTLPSHCLPMFSRSPPNRFGVTTREGSISPHSDEDNTFCETTLKRECNEDVEDQAATVKRRRTLTPDENQRPVTTTSQRPDDEYPEITERLPTGYDSMNLFNSSPGCVAGEESAPRIKCPPIELLCRLFPTQKKSVLQLIYKGCNNDLIKTIECVLPSHEKAVASFKYQPMSIGVPRCPQFIPPSFPPLLPYPMNQHHRLYLPAPIGSESLPLFNMQGGSTFRRGYITSPGYHSKATCQEFNEDSFPVSQRTCPSCHKDLPYTLRACDSCGHCFEVSSPQRG